MTTGATSSLVSTFVAECFTSDGSGGVVGKMGRSEAPEKSISEDGGWGELTKHGGEDGDV